MVLEGRAHVLTCTSRCQQSWEAALIPLKRDEEQGAEKAWATSATDTDLIRWQVLPGRAHPPWRTAAGEFGLIQQLCLSSSVVSSVGFQQSANTSVFVFAYVRLQVNDSVLTLLKQRPIGVLMLTSLRCSHHREHENPQDSTNSVSERPPLRTNVHLLYKSAKPFSHFSIILQLLVDWWWGASPSQRAIKMSQAGFVCSCVCAAFAMATMFSKHYIIVEMLRMLC